MICEIVWDAGYIRVGIERRRSWFRLSYGIITWSHERLIWVMYGAVNYVNFDKKA